MVGKITLEKKDIDPTEGMFSLHFKSCCANRKNVRLAQKFKTQCNLKKHDIDTEYRKQNLMLTSNTKNESNNFSKTLKTSKSVLRHFSHYRNNFTSNNENSSWFSYR